MKPIALIVVAAVVIAIAGPLRAEPPATTRPAPATRPAERVKRLEIKATIDGSDELHITPNGLTWQHKLWDWPTDVQINGQAWDPHNTMPLDRLNVRLANADLSAERVTVVAREARDTVAVEAADDGIVIYFADSPSGADAYSVTLEFGPEPATPNSKGPTTRP